MFDRFTDHAKQLVNVARREAQRLHHAHIGTEHVLLALAALEGGIAVRLLRERGLDGARLRAAVEARVVPGAADSTASELPFTPEVKRVLERSMAQASRLGHRYIGTEHFLLGLLGETDGLAADVLRAHGVDLDDVRREIEQLVDLLEEEDDRAPATGLGRAGVIGDRSSTPANEAHIRIDAETEYRRSWPARALTPLPADWRPFAGRRYELDLLAVSVERRSRPYVVVGRPGVGKSALLDALARREEQRRREGQLDATRLARITWRELAHGARSAAELGRRVALVFASARKLRDLALILDPLPMFEAKAVEAARAVHGALTRELIRADAPCVATATQELFDALARAAPELAACFEPLQLAPSTPEEARAIVAESAIGLGTRWKLFFAPDALDATLELYARAQPKRALPGAALALLETAAAFALERECPEHSEVRALRVHVDELDVERRLRAGHGDTFEARAISSAASHARRALEHLVRSHREARPILRISAADVRACAERLVPPA